MRPEHASFYLSCVYRLALNPHTKFGVPSFTHWKDMKGSKNLKNGSHECDHVHLGIVCYTHRLRLLPWSLLKNLKCVALPVSEIEWGPKIYKGHVILTTPPFGIICYVLVRTCHYQPIGQIWSLWLRYTNCKERKGDPIFTKVGGLGVCCDSQSLKMASFAWTHMTSY